MRKKISPFLLFFLSSLILPSFCFAANPLDIAIIEIAAFEKSGYEWIKIYNNSNQEINLEDWKFVENFSDSNLDGSKHSLNEYNNGYILQTQNSAIICQDADKFISEHSEYGGLILDSSWSSLKESGERIQLLDNEKNIIEDFTYIECKTAVLKRQNFELKDYSANNWSEDINENYNNDNKNENENSDEAKNYSDPTSPLNNKVSENKTSETKKNKSKIIINEILPNPAGADNKKEFIELKNTGNRSVNLKGWKLSDNSDRIYEINNKDFKSTLIKASGLFLIYRNISKIALNNSGDMLKLYNLQEELADKISYKNSVPEDESYARNKQNKWEWVVSPTPGEKNIIKRHPKAVMEIIKDANAGELIIFDASDSYDPDGDELFFFWNFGDGNSSDSIRVVHSYLNYGEYGAKLSVFDNNSGIDELFFTVKIIDDFTDSAKTGVTSGSLIEYPVILISEIFPNPAGADDNEFIELFNPNSSDIDLGGWQLDDGKKGSKAWQIPKNTLIASDSYLTFFKEQTKITLNNSYDSARIINPLGEITAQIDYDKSAEGASYCADLYNGGYYWTYNLTPDEENENGAISAQAGDDNLQYEKYESETPDNKKNVKIIDILEINKCGNGDLIETTGVVAAEPGILGKQIFYLNGAQIYMHSQNFPDLKIGDAVILTGEISITNQQLKIKIKNRDDIFPLSRQEELTPMHLLIEDANKNFISRLISLSGEIVEKKGNTLWLDDKTGEIMIYVNKYTNIDLKQFQEGNFIEIAGMLNITKNGFRLLPRYSSDIKITKILGENKTANEDKKNKENKKFSFIAEKKENYNKYFYITIAGLVIIIGGQIWKYKKNKK